MVRSLTEENPYDVLGLDPDADKETIKQAFANNGGRGSRLSGQERRRRRQAFDVLRSVDERLVVDALMPMFLTDSDSEQLAAELCDEAGDLPDLLQHLDREVILREDLLALVRVTLECTYTELAEPQRLQEPLAVYDGLEEFLHEWLK